MQEAQAPSIKGGHPSPLIVSGIDRAEMLPPLPPPHVIIDSGLSPFADTPETQENTKTINIVITYFFMRHLRRVEY